MRDAVPSSTLAGTPTNKGFAVSTQTSLTRTVNGHDVPVPGTWRIDTAHSELGFAARHMMISRVRGRFRGFSGWFELGERPEDSIVAVTIDAASIDTGDEERDQHLRSPDFLFVDRYPEITYRSTGLRPASTGDRWELRGDLTIRDVTRQVNLDVEFCGATTDLSGGVRAGFLANTEIDREQFAVTWNQVLEAGGFLVGRGVKVEADVEAVLGR